MTTRGQSKYFKMPFKHEWTLPEFWFDQSEYPRSWKDYGSTVFGSAAKSALTALDRIQAQAFQLCLSVVKTSPVCALQVEVGDMLLWLRRKQLATNYWINLRGYKGSSYIGSSTNELGESEDTKMAFCGKGFRAIRTGSRFIPMGQRMHKEMHSVSALTSIQTGESKSHQQLMINIITEYGKCVGKGLCVVFL